MDELKITEFAVVGLSVGGMWGAELAVLAPERVKALMLFDTYLGDETDEAQGSYMTMLNAVDVNRRSLNILLLSSILKMLQRMT